MTRQKYKKKLDVELRGITHSFTKQKTMLSFGENDVFFPTTRCLFFSSIENTLHSLHECHNSLSINTPECNDKQKKHVTDVTSKKREWHQCLFSFFVKTSLLILWNPNLFITFVIFQAIGIVGMTFIIKRCYWNYLPLTNLANLKGMKMIAVASHRRYIRLH